MLKFSIIIIITFFIIIIKDDSVYKYYMLYENFPLIIGKLLWSEIEKWRSPSL